MRGSGRFKGRVRRGWDRLPCFNPLHCGAVVASREAAARKEAEERVSIPFIAGQWSLPKRNTVEKVKKAVAFQSPSLRGSGRFRGDGPPAVGRGEVSIPFIAGQWSLHGEHGSDLCRPPCGFQSPSLRGSGRFRRRTGDHGSPVAQVSIPFIAGQWSLQARLLVEQLRYEGFNPLHCGAVVASRKWQPALKPKSVSIPFIAGQWSLQPEEFSAVYAKWLFQSPSLRGSGRFPRCASCRAAWRRSFQSPSLRGSGRFSNLTPRRLSRACFNPLHCGAVVASKWS